MISIKYKEFFTLLIASLLFVFSGCVSPPSFPKTIKSAQSITVYEGLPHQTREADLLEQEKSRPDIVMISGFPFYKPGVRPNKKQEKQIKRLLGDRSNFYIGQPKDCGPFHPDFSVKWMDEDSTNQIQVCFGCEEVRGLSGVTVEDYDFKKFTELKQLLSEFSTKRPKSEP